MKKNTLFTTQKQQTLLALIGVGIVAVVAVIAVAVSLYTQTGLFAPTAPESRPSADVIQSNTCSLEINIPFDGEFQCVKRIFADEFDNTPGNYNLRQLVQTVGAGDVIVWAIDIENTGTENVTISLTDVLSGEGLELLEFMDSDCGEGAYNAETRTLSCQIPNLTAGSQARRTFRARVSNTAPVESTIKNTVTLVDTTATAVTCSVVTTVTQETEQRQCNESCQTDKECDASSGHVCAETAQGFFCRNTACLNDATCACNTPTPTSTLTNTPTLTPTNTLTSTPSPTPGTGGFSPTPTFTNTPTPTNTNTPTPTFTKTPTPTSTLTSTPTNTPTSTLTPTPVLGCNDSCTVNADCSNANHICYDNNGQKVCRLADHPQSTQCAPATPTPTMTPVATNSPTLTPVTPQLPAAGGTGSPFVIIATGIAILILGALGLLLIL